MATEIDVSTNNASFAEVDEGDSAANGVNGDGDGASDDSDNVRGTIERKTALDDDGDDGGMDDLFGDEDEDEPVRPSKRQLDDEELDSGDDDGRLDRAQDDGDQIEYEEQEKLTMELEVPRQPLPEPSDGEMYLLKVPTFMAIEPRAWQTTTFQPPTTDHHSKDEPSATFSAYNTALTTIRWRHAPSDPSQLQSNARINRWSDGSLTLQLASDPTSQYEMDSNALAPPQRNPIKPTPTSIQGGPKGGRQGTGLNERYDQNKDAFTYLIVPVESAESLRVTHKITAGLSVKQNESVSDDAIERLQAALASAANASKVAGALGNILVTEEDPEMGRKQAELMEKQLARDAKKRANAQERERSRNDRALGRYGLSNTRYGGLNVGMLEDDELEGGDSRSQPRARAKPRRRNNDEYSDDEDFGRKRFSKEDSYDQEDDFLAPSDEEEEVVEDDEDSIDGLVEEAARARDRTPKRDRPRPELAAQSSGAGEDADADGEPDEEVQHARTKRRRVIDDEDE